MIGSYDFCGHYEWTFAWLEQEGGEKLLRDYWAVAIGGDSQEHAGHLIETRGIPGMLEYWGHTLTEEAAGYSFKAREDVFRLDMYECPSKGFLLANGLKQHSDYCDHCIGWIGPVMKKAGFRVHHEHNHCGQCWWEFRRVEDRTPPSECGGLAGEADVRNRPGWQEDGKPDVFRSAAGVEDKGKRETPTAGQDEDL